MKDFFELKANLKKKSSDHISIRMALLGDSATQLLAQALQGMAYEYGFQLHLFETDFDQVERQVFDENSELYQFQPEVVVLHHSTEKLNQYYSKLPPQNRSQLAAERLQLIQDLHLAIQQRTAAKLVYFNYPEANDHVFGNFANKVESSFLFQQRKLNYELMQFALNQGSFFVCDVQSVQSHMGRQAFFNAPAYVNASMVLSLDALPKVAARVMDIVSAFHGKLKKCLVLDLDNTLWGGIIGDDGIDAIQVGELGIGKAFTEFQLWIKKLKDRGIILAVCSKNTESVAKEPFEKHPDMILRLDDFAMFVANWENKAENILSIQKQLNIGLDSMVFLDDNPFERELVKSQLPGICVPHLPEDPAEYVGFLSEQNLFETISFSEEDLERTDRYRTEAERLSFSKTIGTEDEFLKSLQMVSVVEPLTSFNIPRVAQLSQRSNQFNLRTVRYTESELIQMAQAEHTFPFAFGLRDRFGDYGLIAVVVLKAMQENLFIESWFMSCRVLKRGMEQFVLNTLCNFAKENGFKELVGEFIPTAKNELVKDLYQNLGFTCKQGFWYLPLASYTTKEIHITSLQHHELGSTGTL